MAFVTLFVVLAFCWFDSTFLRKQDQATFKRFFSRIYWPELIYALILLILVVVQQKWGHLPQFLLLFVLPVYGIKRLRFKRHLPLTRKDPKEITEGLALALDALTVVIAWALGMMILAICIKALFVLVPSIDSKLVEVVFLSASSGILLVWLINRVTGSKFDYLKKELFGLQRRGLSLFKLVFVPVLVGGILAALSCTILFSRSIQPATPLSELLESTTSSGIFLAFLVVAVLVAPFLEEIIFRGFFFFVLEKNKGRVIAGSVVALIFALFHVEQYWGDWAAILVVALLGAVLSLARALSRSSLPGIVIHYIYNGAMTVIPVVFIYLSCPTYFEFQMHYNDLNVEQKEALLLKAIDENPKFAGSYNDIAWIYADQNINLDKALAMIDQALALEPKNYAFLDTKAEVLYKMGRVDEAVSIARKLVDDYPANPYSKEQLKKFQEKSE